MYGIKVSEPNVDVNTASEEELIINSGFKNVKQSTESAVISQLVPAYPGNNGWTYTYAHGLSYIPTFRVFYDSSDNKWRDGTENAETTGGLPSIIVRPFADTTNITVSVLNADVSNYTVRIKIFVFIERVE